MTTEATTQHDEDGTPAAPDLDTITLTLRELDERIRLAEKRGHDRAWADARRTYQAKATKPEQIEALDVRVGKLEHLVKLTLEKLFPGFSGAPSTNEARSEETKP